MDHETWLYADADEQRDLPPSAYPVLICYDPQEGFFPDGATWDGTKWSQNAVSHFLRRPCDSEKQAKDVAYDNDPKW